MVNIFTIQTKVSRMQRDVLGPLYTVYHGYEREAHDRLLAETGRAIQFHQSYIEELCRSRVVALVFKVVKFLGGAERLTEEDFGRFTSYVREGGIGAMVNMLLAADKEQSFIEELRRLPAHTQRNAPLMLYKSAGLHEDFIVGFFRETYGSLDRTPVQLRQNYEASCRFIHRLAILAQENLKQHRG